MDMTIGDRIRAVMSDRGLSQREVAAETGMTPDALSRALNGQRGFGSVELARIAEILGADMYELVTGRADPNALKIAARHAFSRDDRGYSNGTREADDALLGDVRLAYSQVYRGAEPPESRLPTDPAGLRALLGEGFVRPFAQRIEEALGVDVVRLGELGTDYSFVVHGRPVIALKATASWFRENWSLAHELGHLALRHHEVQEEARAAELENLANGFAAELLLPPAQLQEVDWEGLTKRDLGLLVWEWGVSTEALWTRLRWLRVPVPERVREWLTLSTTDLVRLHALDASEWKSFAERQREAAARRFPASLTYAHEEAVASGAIGKGTLAWMLDVSPETLEVSEPSPAPRDTTEDLAAMLGLSTP